MCAFALKGEHNVYSLVPNIPVCIYIDQRWIYIKLYSASSRFEHCSNHSLNFFCKCIFFKWPPVAILDVQKSLLTISGQYHNFYFCEFFSKMSAGGHFGCPKLTFDGISGHFRSIRNLFLKNCFTKWPPAPILDVQISLLIAFLAISDQYETFFKKLFYKMAAGAHFGCPNFTFDRISVHFRSIRNFIKKNWNFWQNDCRRPFWMSKINFRSHFWPFYEKKYFWQNGCRRPFWMCEIHFRSHFWPFPINTKLFVIFMYPIKCQFTDINIISWLFSKIYFNVMYTFT